MSKPSKNIPMPMSHMIRRWKEEIGSRSSRTPALTVAVAVSSLFIGEHGHASGNQRFNRGAAVLVKRVLLGSEKKFLAAPDSRWIELKNTLDESVGLNFQAVSGTNLRDETDLQGAFGAYGISQQDKRKSKSR